MTVADKKATEGGSHWLSEEAKSGRIYPFQVRGFWICTGKVQQVTGRVHQQSTFSPDPYLSLQLADRGYVLQTLLSPTHRNTHDKGRQ